VSCFRPLVAYRERLSKQVKVGYGSSRDGDNLELPCGKCSGCLQDRARSWSIRIGHEAQLFACNVFVTLDYAPEHLSSWSLVYRDFQGFMKRLRKRSTGQDPGPNGKYPIRFFCAGEYGSKYRRPHFHAIIFNWQPPDRVRLHNKTSRSEFLEDVWRNGNVVIGDVTPESAAYVAGYTVDKRYGRAAEDHYDDVVDTATGEVLSRRPEFVCMSRRPGIGAWWYDRFKTDVLPQDRAVQGGREFKVPRYYWNKFREEAPPAVVEDLEERRYQKAMLQPASERSEERRLVKEEQVRLIRQFWSPRNH